LCWAEVVLSEQGPGRWLVAQAFLLVIFQLTRVPCGESGAVSIICSISSAFAWTIQHSDGRYRHPRPTVLIEDAGSGTSLIQDLKDRNIRAIPIKPDGDKVVRMAAQSAKIEAGEVCLPRHAKWIDDLRTEILAFPHGVHDDQVDSISQALSWMSRPKRQIFAVVA
jgi:predicted phage terminase large subunit-like protein